MRLLDAAGLFSRIACPRRHRQRVVTPRPSFESLEERCLLSGSGQVVQPGITLFKVNSNLDIAPEFITAGSDGNIWFNGILSNKLGRITPAGDISAYSSVDSVNISNLTLGSDGAVWFTDIYSSQIGRIAPDDTFSFFPVKNTSGNRAFLETIAPGVDDTIWFTSGNEIGNISSSGAITLFQQQTQGEIESLTPGPDGNMWFTETSSEIVGKITLSGTITEYAFQSNTNDHSLTPTSITTGPNGNLWFTFVHDNQIGEITPSGTMTLLNLPVNLDPRMITTGPDGSLWFTADHSIGRITTEGVVSQFSVADDGSDYGITTGPDHNLWFTTSSLAGWGDYHIGRADPTALGNGTSVTITATQGNVFTSTVANVTLPTPKGATATIDWGDGRTSLGMLSPNGSGGYFVTGTDAYAAPGNYSITILVTTSTGVHLMIPSMVKVAANPNEGFVMGLYQHLLGRPAEASGASNWIAQLSSGTSRAQIALEIENSPEGRNRLVDQLYVRYLGRHAEFDGMNTFSSMLESGGSLEGVAAAILSSQEFFDRSGGTATGFLNVLYQVVLLRNIDSGALIAIEPQLFTAPSAATRFQIASEVVSSPEAVKSQLQSDYLEILHRSADAGGLEVWSDFRVRGFSETLVRAGLLGSDEFFADT